MHTGKCPKCGGTDIYFSKEKRYIPMTKLKREAVTFKHFACVTCGFVETYVVTLKDIKTIETHWKKLDNTKPKRKHGKKDDS